MFSTCLDNFLPCSSNLKLSSANSFSLEESKNLSSGHGLNRCIHRPFYCKNAKTKTLYIMFLHIWSSGINNPNRMLKQHLIKFHRLPRVSVSTVCHYFIWFFYITCALNMSCFLSFFYLTFKLFLAHLSTECSVSYCDHLPSVLLCDARRSVHNFLVNTLASTNINQSATNLGRMYMIIRSPMSSIMELIGPGLSELSALELENLPYLTLTL